MSRAIFETNRRREIQNNYNIQHGITPKTIKKSVFAGVLETLRGKEEKLKSKKKKMKKIEVTEESIDQMIITLKKKMHDASRELRFEDAASLRDEIKELTEARLLF